MRFFAHTSAIAYVYGAILVSRTCKDLLFFKKSTLILVGIQPRENCRTAFVEQNIMTVASFHILQVIKYVLDKKFTKGSGIHTDNTRDAANFSFPAHRIALFEEKPSYKGAKLSQHAP